MKGEPPKFLTPAELVKRWTSPEGEKAVTSGTLANWRVKTNKGNPAGPSFQKFGSSVRYPLDAIEAFERAGLVAGVGAANDNHTEANKGAA